MYVSEVHASSSGIMTLLRVSAEVRSGEDARSLRNVNERSSALRGAFDLLRG